KICLDQGYSTGGPRARTVPLGCHQPLDPGPCRQYVVRWYYNPEANTCAQYWYGGCQGNKNNFETEVNCRNTCIHM
uniref:BPTI/Kunitz inhibitor domain-containing protein n=1 Tax=Amphilophus citrinellus TaxID=61819 RepID=A0A3Q0R227_AMPCI